MPKRGAAMLCLTLIHQGAVAEPTYETPEAKAMAQRVVQQIRSGLVIDVSARKLSYDYRSNEIAADKKYINKKLFVHGRVHSVTRDIAGNVVVTMDSSSVFMPVMAKFSPAMSVISGLEGNGKPLVSLKSHTAESAALLLRKGLLVRLLCVGDGVSVSLPQLKTCELASI